MKILVSWAPVLLAKKLLWLIPRIIYKSIDLAIYLVFCLERYNDPEPINIGSTNEYKLKDIITLICKKLDYKGDIVYDTTKPKGQVRKPTSNKKFLNLGWKEQFYTPIEIGLEKTCNWFKDNYPNIRGL